MSDGEWELQAVSFGGGALLLLAISSCVICMKRRLTAQTARGRLLANLRQLHGVGTTAEAIGRAETTAVAVLNNTLLSARLAAVWNRCV